jgi:NADH dehydrogenase [ubiquinone] 1 alpha subcomplex assembly factor 1
MCVPIPAVADDGGRILFDFAKPDAAKAWQPVNDGVMGGVSEGRFRITDRGTMEFFGTLSLENNGGFASVRSKAKKLGLEKGDTVVAKVKGDGREYTLNLYLDKPLIAFSYRATVPTKKDEWVEVKVPLDEFVATSFGRPVKDAGAVNPEEINALGFMVSDKKAGPFKLEVESIKVERAGK